jgi:hypothetical protein
MSPVAAPEAPGGGKPLDGVGVPEPSQRCHLIWWKVTRSCKLTNPFGRQGQPPCDLRNGHEVGLLIHVANLGFRLVDEQEPKQV